MSSAEFSAEVKHVFDAAKAFGASVFDGAIEHPYNGLAQLASAGTEKLGLGSLPQMHVLDAEADGKLGWLAKTTGSGLGMVAPFMLTEGALTLLSRNKFVAPVVKLAGHLPLSKEWVKPAVSGAVFGFLMTPTAGEKNILLERTYSGGTGALTFASMRLTSYGTARKLGLDTDLTPGIIQNLGPRMAVNAFAGGVAGGVSAESSALLNHHRLATGSELAESVASFMVTGASLDLGNAAVARLANKSKDNSTDNSTDNQAAKPTTSESHESNPGAMDVQRRLSEGPESARQVRANHPRLVESGNRLVETVSGQLAKTSGVEAKAKESLGSEFGQLVEAIKFREHDGAGMNPVELTRTLDAVHRLITSDKIEGLSAHERLGLAKQMLQESAHPMSVLTGQTTTRGALGLEQMLLAKAPGTSADAVVTLLETGKYKSGTEHPIEVDLTAQTLSKLPGEAKQSLRPDAESARGLETCTQPGGHVASGTQSYYSQLMQTLITNIHSQNTGEHGFVYARDGVFQRQSDGSLTRVTDQATAENAVNMNFAQLQRVFDHVSGVDNASMVLKNGNFFMVADTQGMLTGGGTSRFGLYANDTRFLSELTFKMNGEAPSLRAAESDGLSAHLTYGSKAGDRMADGSVTMTRDVLVVKDGLAERITVKNTSDKETGVNLSVEVGSDYFDMFEVRQWNRPVRGQLLDGVVRPDNSVTLSYRGLDKSLMDTHIRFSERPTQLTPNEAGFSLSLAPGESRTVEMNISAGTNRTAAEVNAPRPTFVEQARAVRKQFEDWTNGIGRVTTTNPTFNQLINRSLLDLYMLREPTANGDGIAAGIPWFVSPFGRDSLITGLQTVEFMPQLSRGILEQMAHWQSNKTDASRAAEPGKMMHELRRGEMARNGETPFDPYYGTVDATPLWLMLLGKYHDWTADRQTVEKLMPNVDRALEYFDRATADNGYLNYGGKGNEALSNQGWKDSADSIMYSNGQLVQAPIALAEVQGYLYAAWRAAAKLKEQLGDKTKADELKQRATDLHQRFNRDFWMPEQNFVALALDGVGRQADVVASNPGHLIGTGLLTPEHAFAVQNRLMQPDMFSGYGIRTKSEIGNPRFDPSSYHNGSIWPHDVSMIVQGMHDLRPGDAPVVMTSLFDAARQMPDLRLPELFGGFRRNSFEIPIPYPVSCIPQAWAAGSMLSMLRANLGMHANALANKLLIYKPSIPDHLGIVDIQGLRVGNNPVSLRFQNIDGRTIASVLDNPGQLEIKVVD